MYRSHWTTTMEMSNMLSVKDDEAAAPHVDYIMNESEPTRLNWIARFEKKVQYFNNRYKQQTVAVRNFVLLVAFLVYFGFAVKHEVGDEGSWRLIGFTIFGGLLLSWRLAQSKKRFKDKTDTVLKSVRDFYFSGKKAIVMRWFLYIAMTAFMVTYVVVNVALRTPENLRSLIGIFGFQFLLFLYSNNKTKVNWHTVYWGMAVQFIMALLVLKTTWGASIIRWIGDRLTEFIANADAGSEFIFGKAYTQHPFVFKSLPSAMLLLVAISVITYLGVITFVVETVGRALAFALQTSPAEGIFMIGTIFLHVPECAILVLDYLPLLTPSQMFIVSAGALSTVGGTAIVIFMSSGIPAAPLVAASVMSAPAALTAGKIAFPSHDDEVVPEIPQGSQGQRDHAVFRKPGSVAEAVCVGISQAVGVLVQATAFLLTFISLVKFVNNTLVWFGDRVGLGNLTLEFILSYVFYPFAFMMGAPHEDCLKIGELLGIRTVSLAVVAYPRLGPLVKNGAIFREYIRDPNNTWIHDGGDIFLETANKTLVGGIINARSEVIATYALCGSASVAIMALILGSFEVIIPHRHGEVMSHMIRAVIVGTVASYLTACFAGLLFEEDIGYF